MVKPSWSASITAYAQLDSCRCSNSIPVVMAITRSESVAFATARPRSSRNASRWLVTTLAVVSVTVSSMPTTSPFWSRIGL
ncbi:hypothetical protein D3C79_1031590 [compost metagenome]